MKLKRSSSVGVLLWDSEFFNDFNSFQKDLSFFIHFFLINI